MLASAVAGGVLVSWILGGRPARLAALELSWWPVLLPAITLRIIAPIVGESLIVWLVSFAAIGLVAAINSSIPGMLLIAAGCAINVLVVVLNGAMPVDPGATALAQVEIPVDGLHRVLRDSDLLSFLADRIPIPPIHRVYSVGDLVLAIGGFWVPFAWMRRR